MSAVEQEFLTVGQLERLTNETESCWRKRLARREIPYVRLGTNVRIRRQDFENWIEARTVRAERRS